MNLWRCKGTYHLKHEDGLYWGLFDMGTALGVALVLKPRAWVFRGRIDDMILAVFVVVAAVFLVWAVLRPLVT